MGVLNDYTNAAAVNAALNKGVEANKAVSELKGDLDGLIINDKHNYCGNGASEDSPAKLTLSERGELYILSEYHQPSFH